MGKITKIQTNNDKVTVTLEITNNEYSDLAGELEKIHIFSEENLNDFTRLVQRGKRDSTKYILVPRDYRHNIMLSDSIKCKTIETNTKKIMIFCVNKY